MEQHFDSKKIAAKHGTWGQKDLRHTHHFQPGIVSAGPDGERARSHGALSQYANAPWVSAHHPESSSRNSSISNRSAPFLGSTQCKTCGRPYDVLFYMRCPHCLKSQCILEARTLVDNEALIISYRTTHVEGYSELTQIHVTDLAGSEVFHCSVFPRHIYNLFGRGFCRKHLPLLLESPEWDTLHHSYLKATGTRPLLISDGTRFTQMLDQACEIAGLINSPNYVSCSDQLLRKWRHAWNDSIPLPHCGLVMVNNNSELCLTAKENMQSECESALTFLHQLAGYNQAPISGLRHPEITRTGSGGYL